MFFDYGQSETGSAAEIETGAASTDERFGFRRDPRPVVLDRDGPALAAPLAGDLHFGSGVANRIVEDVVQDVGQVGTLERRGRFLRRGVDEGELRALRCAQVFERAHPQPERSGSTTVVALFCSAVCLADALDFEPVRRLDHIAGGLRQVIRRARGRAGLSTAGRQVRAAGDHRAAVDWCAFRHLPRSKRVSREGRGQSERRVQRTRSASGRSWFRSEFMTSGATNAPKDGGFAIEPYQALSSPSSRLQPLQQALRLSNLGHLRRMQKAFQRGPEDGTCETSGEITPQCKMEQIAQRGTV